MIAHILHRFSFQNLVDSATLIEQSPLRKGKNYSDLWQESCPIPYKAAVCARSSVTELLLAAFFATLQKPDRYCLTPDEILVVTPYPKTLLQDLCPFTVIYTETPKDFKITPDTIRFRLTARTKWLLWPAPTPLMGDPYTTDEMAAIAALLMQHPHVSLILHDLQTQSQDYPSPSLLTIEPRLFYRTLVVKEIGLSLYPLISLACAMGPQHLIDQMQNFSTPTHALANILMGTLHQAPEWQDHQKAYDDYSVEKRQELAQKFKTQILVPSPIPYAIFDCEKESPPKKADFCHTTGQNRDIVVYSTNTWGVDNYVVVPL